MKKIITILVIAFLAITLVACESTTTEEINYWSYMTRIEDPKTIILLDYQQDVQEVFVTFYYNVSETETLYLAPSYMYNNSGQRWNRYFYGYILVESIYQESFNITQVDTEYLDKLFKQQINEIPI